MSHPPSPAAVSSVPLLFWFFFHLLVFTLLALDLGVFHRKAHAVGKREALAWSLFWIALSLTFNAGVYFRMGPQKALEFFTGYVVEYSLSLDNVFVFVLLFSYFAVPAQYQHRVLFWGIIGALVMRGTMIALGTVLLARFHWIIYVFGAFLVITGIRMAGPGHIQVEPEHNPMLRLVRRLWPVTEGYEGQQFFVRRSGRWMVTPLLVVLSLVETTDLIFAVDSIPAVFAITRDPFIVYTSNVLAVLGLRSLYFLLAAVITSFQYLHVGLGIVLVYVGTKMLLSDVFHIPVAISLAVIFVIVSVSILISWLRTRAAAVRPSAQE